MKKSVVGVYASHEAAVHAVQKLLNGNLSKEEISLVGRAKDVNGDMHLPHSDIAKAVKPAAIGGAIGILTGILTGIGVFAIPGLGFVYGAGALIGAIAGFDFGLIAGGMVSFVEIFAEDEHKHTITEYLENNHHLVVYTGDEKDKAEEILKGTSKEDVFH